MSLYKKAIFIFVISVMLSACSHNEKTEPSVPSSAQVDSKKANVDIEPLSSTTGTLLTEPAANGFSVMIENSLKARPHSGLAEADVVYEMTVEGGITRFLAIFHDAIPSKIGPVRSSRHYFLDVVDDWNTPYIHYGASPQAYAQLSQLKQTHIDGITKEKYFSRDASRTSPHNAYLHPNRLPVFTEDIHNKSFYFGTKNYENSGAKTVLFNYNSFTHVKYVYDTENKVYKRELEGIPHSDRESDKQIRATNVIAQYASHSPALDESGRIEIDFSKGGKAIYFFHGKAVYGNWKQDGGTMKYLDGDGNAMVFPAGKTWIQIVDANKQTMSYTQ
ncbi:MAG: DUF3048 domain-containing protein [Ectobacillus sp.]